MRREISRTKANIYQILVKKMVEILYKKVKIVLKRKSPRKKIPRTKRETKIRPAALHVAELKDKIRLAASYFEF